MLNISCFLCDNWSNVVANISLFTSLFAFVLTFGYWVKPRLRFCVYQSDIAKEEQKWKVKVVNRNLLCNSVVDVHCEVALSINNSFSKANTIELIKSSSLLVRKCPDEYIFICKENIKFENPVNKYSHIRVRLVAPNFLGVRKVIERIEKISDLQKEDCKPKR